MAPLPQHGSAIDQCVAVDVVQKGASKLNQANMVVKTITTTLKFTTITNFDL